MIIPVVTGDVDPGAVEELIALCVCYHRLRTGTPDPAGIPGSSGSTPDGTDTGSTGTAAPASAAVPAGLASRAARQADLSATVAASLAEMEHQILAKILQVLSGPGGVASFLRRQLQTRARLALARTQVGRPGRAAGPGQLRPPARP